MAVPRKTLLTFPVGVKYPPLLCPPHSFSAETCLTVLKEWDRTERTGDDANRICCSQCSLMACGVRAQGIWKSTKKGVWSEGQLKTKRKEKQGVWMDGVQASLTSACLCSISEPLGTMSSGTSDSCVWADVILIKLCLPGLDPAGIRDYYEDSSVLHRLWSHCCLYPAQIFPRYIFSSPHHWQLPYLFQYPSKWSGRQIWEKADWNTQLWVPQ